MTSSDTERLEHETHGGNLSEELVKTDHWHDDLLGRKQYADFLTTYLDQKCRADQPALVVALDAAWGLGKTFFVKRWAQDLRDTKRPVISFDAWENDSSEEPAVSFMAELRAGLAPLYGQLPAGQTAIVQIQAKSKEMVGNLRKATMPALAVVGKALLKKTTGLAVDELMEAVTDATASPDSLNELGEAAPETLEKGLDKFFEKTLQGHAERIRSVKAFRQSLEELLDILHKSEVAVGPLYVFVDELDRCRPDYAIRLLEGVKHLFSVRGVVFVVSTNLGQLSKAVSAVYGPHFDGYSYLKRFFDFEYQLPDPPRFQFITTQMQTSCLDVLKNISGLNPAFPDEATPAHAMAVVADAFNLNLRSLQRVFLVADAALSGLKPGTPVLTVWLFFLATLRHLHPEEFAATINGSYDGEQFEAMCKRVLIGNQNLKTELRNERGPTGKVGFVSFLEVISIMYEATKLDAAQLRSIAGVNDWGVSYPASLRHELLQEWNFRASQTHPIQKYGQLILAAGHISR